MNTRRIHKFLGGVSAYGLLLAISAITVSGCGDPFSSCDAHRSCPMGGKGGGGGGAGAAGAGRSSGGTGGASGAAAGGVAAGSGGSANGMSGGSDSSGAGNVEGGDSGLGEGGVAGDQSGGASDTGGTDAGGKASGGTWSGGVDGGGKSSGGASSGGVSTGGTYTGGKSSTGGSSGGTSTGGKASGGATTGGSTTGGKSSGGASTGGAASGTGGAPSNGCTSNPCLNGATCTPGTGSSYTCACGNRFVGSRCEIQKFLPTSIWPTALSADGNIIVGKACAGQPLDCPPAKVVSAGGAPTFLALPSVLPVGYAVSGCVPVSIDGTGSWIGAICDGGAIEWKGSNTATLFPGRTSTESVTDLKGASFDGSIVVGRLANLSVEKTLRWFRRIPTSGIVPLALDRYNEIEYSTLAAAVSNDGLVVIGNSDWHPLRWDSVGQTQPLPEIPGLPSPDVSYRTTDISGDGAMIVGYMSLPSGATTAVRRPTPTTIQSLGAGSPRAVNKNGSLIVGSEQGACAWDLIGTRKTILELLGATPDVNGWTLTEAIAVSDDGKVIVGTGTNPSQQSQGWVVHLP